MTTTEWHVGTTASPTRRVTAALLRAASRGLARLARRLGRRSRHDPERLMVLEFYAEAGAPEGALYVDGRLVGHVHGVTRL
jgi:hypothetical protein